MTEDQTESTSVSAAQSHDNGATGDVVSPVPSQSDVVAPEPVAEDADLPQSADPELASSALGGSETAEPETLGGPDMDTAGAASTKKGTHRKRLEEEGDVAADYLEELLDIADLDGDIDIDVENDRAAVSIIGDDSAQRGLNRLVGQDGEVLEALQELTRLAVAAKTGDRSRLMLDVAGYRAQRRTALEKMAADAVASVKADGSTVRFEPMTPFERKVVHDVVAAAGLTSESEGEGSNRRVVISPA